jgi:AraC-like DNA-binding protein
MENSMDSEIGQPKGILKQKEGEKRFQLTRLLPGEDLRPFIEFYWSVSWDLRGQEPYVSETLSHPCVHLVFERDQALIFGVNTGKFSRLLEGQGRAFSVKFKPGAFYPFVHVPISTFTDTTISLRDALGVETTPLERAVFAQEDVNEMQRIVEDFLRARLPERDEQVAKIGGIVEYISVHPEITRVDEIVSLFNLNKRTLQRLFQQYVGVSPKWVIKRYRLHEAAERVASGKDVDWARLALDLEYFDQAHFIKDFKAIVGKTPAEYAKQV